MKGLTLSTKEQNRLQVLNGVLERHWSMQKAAPLLGVSERQGWRLLAAYRKEGARGLGAPEPRSDTAQRHSRGHPATSGGPCSRMLSVRQPHPPD